MPLAGQRGFDELELAGHGARELHADARGFSAALSHSRRRPGARQIQLQRLRARVIRSARTPASDMRRELGIDGGQVGAAPRSG